MQLQANLSQEVKGFGDLDFNRFRGFSSTEKTSEEPFRFVDGDFIEKFLELPEEIMEKVAKGRKKNQKLSMGVEELKTLVENLKRLH